MTILPLTNGMPIAGFSLFATFTAIPSWIFGFVFFPYFAGAVVLAAGLRAILKRETSPARGLDKILPFGRLFFAVPMAVFGAQHFTAARFVAPMVPPWIPWHLFWTYFVGTALIAAALSIVTEKQTRLAAPLLGIMIFLFVALIHVPDLVRNPHDRIQLAVFLRDLAFSGGALALAGSETDAWRAQGTHPIIPFARFYIAVAVIFFAVEQFLHPGFAPGVPLGKVTPAWIPAAYFWSYLSAVVFLIAGVALVFKKHARMAATCLGIEVLLVVAFVYLPILIAMPADIANGLNYFADTLAFGGTALLLAAALPHEPRAPARRSSEAIVSNRSTGSFDDSSKQDRPVWS